uniref:Murine leukemia virus integrase C-terminal domain-containing protein n=1 Tax=Chelonoidis abingdonii TaxID=106734 RepID=A0A8C0HCI6_CHEAB
HPDPEPHSPDVNANSFQPSDFVLVKIYKKQTLQPVWGPFQILLTTPMAIKVAERDSWIHYTRAKKDYSVSNTLPPQVSTGNKSRVLSPEDQWMVQTLPGLKLKFTRKGTPG